MINLFLCSLVVAQPRESMNTTTPKINSTVFIFFNNPFTSASLFRTDNVAIVAGKQFATTELTNECCIVSAKAVDQ